MRRTGSFLPFLLVILASAATVIACGQGEVGDILPNRDQTPTPTPPSGQHHPAGWAAASQHGPAALFVQEDCRGCHGTQLEGATEVGCDSCHAAGWRTNCVFCHGGSDNQSGAPPRDLTGAVAQDDLIFKSHTKHVATTAVATPFDCVQCHADGRPADALTANHWFDATPARAEIVFANGLSPAGTYDYGNGRCSALYCHGNGRGNNGISTYSDGPKACNGCHPFLNSSSAQWGTMSGEHRRHLGGDVDATCVDCHGATVNVSNAISNPAIHVNTLRETMFTGTNIVYNAGTKRCTGTCHGDNHQNEGW